MIFAKRSARPRVCQRRPPAVCAVSGEPDRRKGAVGGQTICGMAELHRLLMTHWTRGCASPCGRSTVCRSLTRRMRALMCVSRFTRPSYDRRGSVRATKTTQTSRRCGCAKRTRRGRWPRRWIFRAHPTTVLDKSGGGMDPRRATRFRDHADGPIEDRSPERHSSSLPGARVPRDAASLNRPAIARTPEQAAIVACEAPIVRVLARAGTGKTTTMVDRAGRVLERRTHGSRC